MKREPICILSDLVVISGTILAAIAIVAIFLRLMPFAFDPVTATLFAAVLVLVGQLIVNYLDF